MGRLSDKSDYESLRDARISENMARMELLGLRRHAGELSLIASTPRRCAGSTTPKKTPKPRSLTPLRRSSRLIAITASPSGSAPGPRRSARLKGQLAAHIGLPPKGTLSNEEEVVVVVDRERLQALQERRCESRGRGGVYDPVLGICCHFCRQKKLCGEEDCRRCGEGDLNQPCIGKDHLFMMSSAVPEANAFDQSLIGKTECSSCQSSNGVLCRACLKVRYGEEMEEVRKDKNWMCPHCIEEKGIKKFWICNSSFCLKKRKMAPTGIAIYDALEQGYKSVAHLLMDKLKRRAF